MGSISCSWSADTSSKASRSSNEARAASGWITATVASAGADGRRHERHIVAGRHPSALLLNDAGTRLFAASGSTDRVTVIDTKRRRVMTSLRDAPPQGPGEGATPNGLA